MLLLKHDHAAVIITYFFYR